MVTPSASPAACPAKGPPAAPLQRAAARSVARHAARPPDSVHAAAWGNDPISITATLEHESVDLLAIGAARRPPSCQHGVSPSTPPALHVNLRLAAQRTVPAATSTPPTSPTRSTSRHGATNPPPSWPRRNTRNATASQRVDLLAVGAARRPTRCRHGGSPSTPLASLALSSAATSASPRSAPSTTSPAQRRARRTLPRSICARSAHRGTSQQNARSRWPGVEARACARRLVPEPAPGQRAQVPARPDVARRTWDSPRTARAVANDRSGSGSHGGTAR